MQGNRNCREDAAEAAGVLWRRSVAGNDVRARREPRARRRACRPGSPGGLPSPQLTAPWIEHHQGKAQHGQEPSSLEPSDGALDSTGTSQSRRPALAAPWQSAGRTRTAPPHQPRRRPSAPRRPEGTSAHREETAGDVMVRCSQHTTGHVIPGLALWMLVRAGVFVVEGCGSSGVEDAEALGELAEGRLVTDVSVAELLVAGGGSG